MIEELSGIKFEDFTVFPYVNFQDARAELDRASKHFEEEFYVREIQMGYVLASKTRVLDVRGFCVSKDSPLKGGLEAFREIIKVSNEI